MKKNTIKITVFSLLALLSINSCDRFEDINKNPDAATSEQILPEYFLTSSILGAQMNPEVAERTFVIYWKTAGRQHYQTFIAGGNYDDGYTTNYWGYISGWLNNANKAIQIANEKKLNGTASNYNENVIQISRIWRAYLMSELSDNFGPIPNEAFQGVNPEFNSQKDVYYYILSELKDAVAKIDPNITGMSDKTKAGDLAYQMDWNKWVKYGNSLRMRLAMRLSEVDASKAKTEFEDAVSSNKFISNADENFAVAEKDGWNDLTGVMSRPWNQQIISATLNNLYLGLGGVPSQNQLSSDLQSYIKPDGYIGKKFTSQYPQKTNDPSTGYFLDGLPNKIDPRAYKTFFIPGNTASPIFPQGYALPDAGMMRDMRYSDGSKVTVNTKYSWNAYTIGNWGTALSLNDVRGSAIYTPSIGQQYRNSTNKRVFFGSWESYLLIAEANLRGWITPMSDEAAYNKGVQESLSYNGVGQYYSTYITSTDYNRDGTSASYSHTTEPGASHSMTYIDPKTNVQGNVNINYPSNTIYKGENIRNDKLTKIITQKFIANTPWLPLETWSDQRRLGLPFFENPAVETPLPNLPNLNSSNFMTNSVKNFPQRLPYPSSFRNSDPNGYTKAVQLLGGADEVLTPLWWAKH